MGDPGPRLSNSTQVIPYFGGKNHESEWRLLSTQDRAEHMVTGMGTEFQLLSRLSWGIDHLFLSKSLGIATKSKEVFDGSIGGSCTFKRPRTETLVFQHGLLYYYC